MPGEPHEEGSTRKGGVEGKYANHFRVGHNAFEFLLDFGQLFSDGEQEHIHTRIVTSPSYAQELLEILDAQMEQYEQAYGPIKERE
jgi:Protein of unknown function (DUF3467)